MCIYLYVYCKPSVGTRRRVPALCPGLGRGNSREVPTVILVVLMVVDVSSTDASFGIRRLVPKLCFPSTSKSAICNTVAYTVVRKGSTNSRAVFSTEPSTGTRCRDTVPGHSAVSIASSNRTVVVAVIVIVLLVLVLVVLVA